jgi:hypothetical protein
VNSVTIVAVTVPTDSDYRAGWQGAPSRTHSTEEKAALKKTSIKAFIGD